MVDDGAILGLYIKATGRRPVLTVVVGTGTAVKVQQKTRPVTSA